MSKITPIASVSNREIYTSALAIATWNADFHIPLHPNGTPAVEIIPPSREEGRTRINSLDQNGITTHCSNSDGPVRPTNIYANAKMLLSANVVSRMETVRNLVAADLARFNLITGEQLAISPAVGPHDEYPDSQIAKIVCWTGTRLNPYATGLFVLLAFWRAMVIEARQYYQLPSDGIMPPAIPISVST